MKDIKFQKIDTNNKTKKIILFAVLILLFTGVIIFMVKKTHSAQDDELLTNQYVDGLSFENAKIKYVDGTSTFSVEVYNETDNIYNLKKIEIYITDESDKEIRLLGYIGEKINAEEGKYLETSIDADLTNFKKIRYVINK